MLELLHGPDRTANSMELLARICENAAHGVAGADSDRSGAVFA